MKKIVSVWLCVLTAITPAAFAKISERAGLDIYRQEMMWIKNNQPSFRATNASVAKNFYRKHLKQKMLKAKPLIAGTTESFLPFYNNIERMLNTSKTFSEFRRKLEREIQRLSRSK